jgi:hypothetical protein
MEDLKGSNLGCTAGDVEFVGVTGVVVYDEGAYLDTDGIWKGEKYKRLSVFSVRLCQTVRFFSMFGKVHVVEKMIT